MTTLELKTKSAQMINTLITQAVINNTISILGKSYRVIHKGEHYISLEGNKGAQYKVSTSPKCVIIENKNLNVYFLVDRRGKSVDFTLLNTQSIELVTL